MKYNNIRIRNKGYYFAVFIFWIVMVVGTYSCAKESKNEKAVIKHCSSCHLVPEPQHLPSRIWETNVLPTMADYFRWQSPSSYDYANVSIFQKKGFSPMTDEEWTNILEYYIENSPDSLEVRKDVPLANQSFFKVHHIDNVCQIPAVTSIGSYADSIFLIACENAIHKIKLDGQVLNSWDVEDVVTQMANLQNGSIEYLDVGLLDPHDIALGNLKKLDELTGQIATVIDSLYRPVDYSRTGSSVFVSEFGNNIGRLTVHDEDDKWSIISNLPGSYRLEILDIDGDENDELIFMAAQAYEGIYVSEYKEGKWQVPQPRLIFGSMHGLSDMDVKDCNGDGFPDIVLANGDNADYSVTLKNYHGVRVYLNDGEGNFSEAYFYPNYGATQVKWIDVNADQHLDIVTSSYFPQDYNTSVTILVNKGNDSTRNLAFDPYHLKESDAGRWMVMEAFDFDNDNDEDILMGSFIIGPTNVSAAQYDQWLTDGSDVLLLENLSITE